MNILIKGREDESFVPDREGSNGDVKYGEFYVEPVFGYEAGIACFTYGLRGADYVANRNRNLAEMSVPGLQTVAVIQNNKIS